MSQYLPSTPPDELIKAAAFTIDRRYGRSDVPPAWMREIAAYAEPGEPYATIRRDWTKKWAAHLRVPWSLEPQEVGTYQFRWWARFRARLALRTLKRTGRNAAFEEIR